MSDVVNATPLSSTLQANLGPRRQRGQLGRHAVVHLLLAAGAVVMIFPFIWEFFTAFKSDSAAVSIPPKLFPDPWVFTNFAGVFDQIPF